jgi:hypothetical protein
VRTGTHDYIRHGTITLFAALSYIDGKIIHQTAERYTHKEWLSFIKKLAVEAPEGLTVDCIRDGSFTSITELVESIETYIAERDLEPKRYVWTAQGEEILRKIKRAKDSLQLAEKAK